MLILLSSVAALAVAGDGHKVTTTHAVAPEVTRVVVGASLDLVLTEGPERSLAITIDENLQPLVETTVRGDTLVIETRGSMRYSGEGSVALTLPLVRGVSLTGSGDGRVTTGPEPRDLELETTGSGDLSFRGAARKLVIRSSGSGSVEVVADADEVEAAAQGSGGLTHRGAAKRLSVELSGSGDARLSGRVETLEARALGSGSVEARALTAHSASVTLSGSGDAAVTVDGGSLTAVTQGSGDIDWWGRAASIEQRESGSGDVNRH